MQVDGAMVASEQPVVDRARRGSIQGEVFSRGPQANQKKKTKRVDTTALTGLRGLAAMQVAAGHVANQTHQRVDLIGSAAMPFFFLLTGRVVRSRGSGMRYD